MQTLENLILQKCTTEFFDIAHIVLGYVYLKFVQMVLPPGYVCLSGYNNNNVKLYNITIIVHYNV